MGIGAYNNVTVDRALAAHTKASDWKWQKDQDWWSKSESDTQWRISDDGYYFLRRVHSDAVVQAYLRLTDEDSLELVGQALFTADCSIGKSIATEATYSDGEPMELTCIEAWGRPYLFASVLWVDVDFDNLPSWKTDLSGFAVNENFGLYWNWDFGPARRHLTLSQLKN